MAATRRVGRYLVIGSLPLGALLAQEPETDPGEPGPQIIEVSASEFRFEPRAITIAAGPTTFLVRNDGMVDHDFVIERGRGNAIAATEPISPGATAQLVTTLEAGQYLLVCAIPGHREARMIGALAVER